MRPRRLLLAPLVLLLGLSACRYSELHGGDDRFLQADMELVAGRTTAAEVADALGAPDDVLARGEELWFVYRYEEAVLQSIVLRYFGGKWFQGTIERRRDRSLIVAFDPADRLLHYAVSGTSSEAPADAADSGGAPGVARVQDPP